MNKTEMLQVETSLIDADKTSQYLEFHETIFDTINETYRCIYYLDGVKEMFGSSYQCKGYAFEYFFKDIVKFVKQKICVNIWKLLLDKGKDALSIYRMKEFNKCAFNCDIKIKNIKIPASLEDNLSGIRNASISHNLHTNALYTIDTVGLKPLLNEIYKYFQQLWIGNFVDDHLFISDGYFESLEQLYKGSVKDALKGIKP